MSGQRKALIIANDEYEQDGLSNLLAPGADAEALGRVLGDRQIGGFAVQVVRNEPAHVIEAQIEDLFAESRPDDVLLLHFSGHGLKSESGALFFAASNTRPNRLRATAVSADFVRECMQESRSRSIVLLLDCCYGGAFAQGVRVRAAGDVNVLDSFPQKRSGGRGRAVITASNAMEYAFEGDRVADDQHQRPSVFTGALVKGLVTGDADRDEDGWISLNELYDYIFNEVREQNPHQTPSRQVELEGDLYLARSQRRRIRPVPIPPDLQAAITDANIYTRRGAVHELQSRLASEDLPVAAGAYEALTELARTDVRYVADLATAAVSQVAVRPEETELHFGEVRQGSEPPHRLVRLLGPPIARACASRVSHDWIRVNQGTDGFDISVMTTSTGTLSGNVDLKGPTGAAVIAIDVESLPQLVQTSATRRPSRQVDERGTSGVIPTNQPKEWSATKGSQEAWHADKRKAAEQTDRYAADAAHAQAVRPDRSRTLSEDEPIDTLVKEGLDPSEQPGGRHMTIQEETAVPAMPDIKPSEKAADDLHPLLDGFSPTIGWQFRRQDKGGPAFVTIRRSVFGMFKVVGTFPMTEDGWASAWQSFTKLNPDAVPHVLATLSHMAGTARLSSPEPREASQLEADSLITTPDVAHHGGHIRGFETISGQRQNLPSLEDQVLSASPVEGLSKLAEMLEKGLLTREEFDLIKAKVLGL